MKVMLAFVRTMFTNGRGLAVWVALLMTANVALPMLFITTSEGQVVLLSAMAGAILQTAIFARLGFVRLLGVGHVFWVPLVPWLWSRLDSLPPEGAFGYWVLVTVLLNSLSLIIDVVDVGRYLAGDRTPHLRAAQ